jgi:hypothetical protein
MLTPQERKLFEAIKGKDGKLVSAIIQGEELLIQQGHTTNIHFDAKDEAGDTFCHCAAQTGIRFIIDKILLSSINFAHDIPNYKGELPQELSWNGIFKELLPARKKKDEERRLKDEAQQLSDRHKKNVEEIKNKEIQAGGYKKGIIFTSDFTLTYNSKKSAEKNCIIPDKSGPDGPSIHDRQAIDEAMAFNQLIREGYWAEEPTPIDCDNYLLANLGLVIGVEKYQKPSKIKRRFYSFPLYLSEGLKKDSTYNQKENLHSEMNLYHFLLDGKYLQHFLNDFRRRCSIQPQEKRKIYACIIDIHSSQDVCDECELKTYDFEQKLVDLIKVIAAKVDFEVSKDFRTVVRASSSRPSRGFREFHRNRIKDNKFQDFTARTYTHSQPMDLRKSDATFMLHYDDIMREERGANWYKKSNLFNTTIKQIPPRTLFFVWKKNRPHCLSYCNHPFPENYEIKKDEDFPFQLHSSKGLK